MNNRIKEIRRHPKINLSQEAFGKHLGITGSSVSLLESGRNQPSDQTIMLICREYGVNEKWLRTGEGEMFVEAANDSLLAIVREYNLDRDDYYVLSEFVQLPPAERRAVIGYMRRVVARIDGMKPEAEAGERVRYPQDMTREEYHREIDRQLDEEERQGESALASGS